MNSVQTFNKTSELFKETGGVHSAMICDREGEVAFSEDIGRHNAMDKVIGYCINQEIDFTQTYAITSGRISSEILLKVAKANIPILISRSAPTDLAVEMATTLGMTLVGFARGTKANIYSHQLRISL